jgi:hypothetical protein
MDSNPILTAFEYGGTLIYVLAFAFSLRERNPFYLGIFVSCNLLVFWDWIFNLKWFFNVVFHPDLTQLWSIQGEHETLAAALAFVGFYYWVFHLLTKYAGALDRTIGRWQYPALYVGSGVYVLAFEILFVNLGVWTYYQQDAFEWRGAVWSNAFFNSHIILMCYLLLRAYRRWGGVDLGRASLNPAQGDAFWRPFMLGLGAVQTGVFLAFALQMIWYINMQPWAPSPRDF